MRIMELALFVLGCALISEVLVFGIEVDGERDEGYGDPLVVQKIQTGFGDPGSELDAAYAIVSEGKLYLMLTGNLEPNFNKLEIFIDSKLGGQNKIIATQNPNNDNWATKFDGFTFDSGFFADYLLIVRHGLNGTQLDVDFAELGKGGKGELVGRFDPVNLGKAGPFEASNGLIIGFNNTNSAGIGSNQGQLADQEGATLVRTGSEFAIPLDLIGSPKGKIKICAMINGHGHDYLSNQFLGSMPEWTRNLGTNGQGDFVQDSSLKDVDLKDYEGDQFFVVPAAVAPLQIVDFSYEAESENFSITWASAPDSFYTFESSVDMMDWQEIDDGIKSQGEETTYDLIIENKNKSRFYRIVEE